VGTIEDGRNDLDNIAREFAIWEWNF